MKRNKMIIISITSIIIIALMLVGLTFGYYLTKISGNENSKSVSVTSAKKQVEFKDLSNEVNNETIEPGYEHIKVFTVKNIGDTEANYHIYLDEVVNEFNRTQDITFTLYRKSGNNTIDTSNLSDSDIVASGTFPKTNAYILVNEKITTPGDYYTYAFKVSYINSDQEQDIDQGKTFSYKIQLHAEIINPYSKNTDTLAYNIINNAINVSSAEREKNYAEFRATPLTTPAVETTATAYKSNEASITSMGTYSMSVSTTLQNYYWTYGTGYTVDPDTGKFTLTGVSTCKYSSCYSSLAGKYIVDASADDNAKSTNTQVNTTNLSGIFRIENAPASSSSSVIMSTTPISSELSSVESELTTIPDEYGTSYYFRGNVENNYMNFAGMCWRVVRIEGNGSIKLILEDYYSTCDSSSYTGNWTDDYFGYYGFGYANLGSNNYTLNFLGGNVELASALQRFQEKIDNPEYNLNSGDWCYDETAYENENGTSPITDRTSYYNNGVNFYYGAYTRIYNQQKPVLACAGEKLSSFADGTDMYVGALTADEVVYAGLWQEWSETKPKNYLINDFQNGGYDWWTLSPSRFTGDDLVYEVVGGKYFLVEYQIAFERYMRPAVSIQSGLSLKNNGDGSRENPYEIWE